MIKLQPGQVWEVESIRFSNGVVPRIVILGERRDGWEYDFYGKDGTPERHRMKTLPVEMERIGYKLIESSNVSTILSHYPD